MLPLASREAGTAVHAVYEPDGGQIVRPENDFAFLVESGPAPDGDDPPLNAGRGVVQPDSGRVVSVIGQPRAAALSAPVD